MSETTYYGLTVPQMIGITVGLFVIIFIYVIIKDKINRKKAQGGGDRDTVWAESTFCTTLQTRTSQAELPQVFPNLRKKTLFPSLPKHL